MSDSPALSSPASLLLEISTPCPTPLFPSAFSRLSQPRTVAQQLEEATVGELPANPTIEDLPKVVWKNRRFVQEALLARKDAKGRKSWIRLHGMFFVELNHQEQPIGQVWCCSRCDTKGRPELFSVQATSSAADHLRKAHRITPASQSSPSDSSAINLHSHAAPKRPRLNQSMIPRAKVRAVQELSVGFVINSDVPFTIFEHRFLKEADSFELESDINGIRGLPEQDLRHWRSKGPIGKLHNIVKFIRSSPQRSEYFKRIAHKQECEGYRLCKESTAELEVVLNNDTRWNSTYMMIERALRKQTAIRAFIFALEGEHDEAKRIPADDILSNEDWHVLCEANEILTPLYLQTMRTQGWGKGDGHGRLWEVLVVMKYLLEHFEDWKGFYNEVTTEKIRVTNLDDLEPIGIPSTPLIESEPRPTRARRHPARFDDDKVYVSQQRSQTSRFTVSALSEHSQTEYAALDKPLAYKVSQKSSLPVDHRAYIQASINNGWKKLDEYYIKLGESSLFAAAVILHPRFGISWLEAIWVTEEQLAWVRHAKAGIKDYFAQRYHTSQQKDKEQSKSALLSIKIGKEDNHYTQWINSRTRKIFATGGSVSELDEYLVSSHKIRRSRSNSGETTSLHSRY